MRHCHVTVPQHLIFLHLGMTIYGSESASNSVLCYGSLGMRLCTLCSKSDWEGMHIVRWL